MTSPAPAGTIDPRVESQLAAVTEEALVEYRFEFHQRVTEPGVRQCTGCCPGVTQSSGLVGAVELGDEVVDSFEQIHDEQDRRSLGAARAVDRGSAGQAAGVDKELAMSTHASEGAAVSTMSGAIRPSARGRIAAAASRLVSIEWPEERPAGLIRYADPCLTRPSGCCRS